MSGPLLRQGHPEQDARDQGCGPPLRAPPSANPIPAPLRTAVNPTPRAPGAPSGPAAPSPTCAALCFRAAVSSQTSHASARWAAPPRRLRFIPGSRRAPGGLPPASRSAEPGRAPPPAPREGRAPRQSGARGQPGRAAPLFRTPAPAALPLPPGPGLPPPSRLTAANGHRARSW